MDLLLAIRNKESLKSITFYLKKQIVNVNFSAFNLARCWLDFVK